MHSGLTLKDATLEAINENHKKTYDSVEVRIMDGEREPTYPDETIALGIHGQWYAMTPWGSSNRLGYGPEAKEKMTLGDLRGILRNR